MSQYDLTIRDLLKIQATLPDHMKKAQDRLLSLCEDWGHDSRIGTMTLGNVDGLATMTFTFRLPFEEGPDLDSDSVDEYYRRDCENMRATLVKLGLVSELFPLKSIYDFWSDYSAGMCAGWIGPEGMSETSLEFYFGEWRNNRNSRRR
jgi:hypothetical protein